MNSVMNQGVTPSRSSRSMALTCEQVSRSNLLDLPSEGFLQSSSKNNTLGRVGQVKLTCLTYSDFDLLFVNNSKHITQVRSAGHR